MCLALSTLEKHAQNLNQNNNTYVHNMQAIGIDHSLTQDKTPQDLKDGCNPVRTLVVLAATLSAAIHRPGSDLKIIKLAQMKYLRLTMPPACCTAMPVIIARVNS